MADPDRDPPFEGGSQPVPEHPPEVPGPGRSATQVVVVVIAALALLAAVAWGMGYLGR